MLAHAVGAGKAPGENPRNRSNRCHSPFGFDQQRRKCFRDSVRAVYVDVELEVHLLFINLDQRFDHGDTGIVDNTVQAAARLTHHSDRGINFILMSDIQTYGLHVIDFIELREILVLASAGINEVAPRSQHLGNLAADTGARPSHQDRLLCLRFRRWRGFRIGCSNAECKYAERAQDQC